MADALGDIFTCFLDRWVEARACQLGATSLLTAMLASRGNGEVPLNQSFLPTEPLKVFGKNENRSSLSASSCDEATIETRKRFLGAKRSGTMAEACTRSFAAVSVQNIVPTGWFLFPKDDAAWLDTRRDQQLLSLALYCLKSPTRQCSGYFSSHLADRCVECTVHVGDREQVESSSRFFAEAEQSSATSTALLSQYCKLRFYETATW